MTNYTFLPPIREECLSGEYICDNVNGTWVPVEPADWLHFLPRDIHNNYLWVIMAVGLPGNMAAIFTMASVTPFTTATFLVALLAASDSAAIVVKLLINRLYSYHLGHPTVFYCRVFPLANVCSTFANWILVLIAVERLVAVVRPLSRGSFLSKRRMAALCCGLALVIFSFHAPFVFFQRIGRPDHPSQCYAPDHLVPYQQGAYDWIRMLLYAFLPLTLLFLTTSGISLALSRARKRRGLLLAERRTAGRAPRAMREATRSERALTLMMLAASILMMVLMLPVCLYYIIDHHTNLSDDENIRPELWRQIVHVMADSTHALNFYLYFVSVASFRRKFVTLVTCRKPRRRPFRSREEQNSSSTPVTTHVTLNHVENVQGDGPNSTGNSRRYV